MERSSRERDAIPKHLPSLPLTARGNLDLFSSLRATVLAYGRQNLAMECQTVMTLAVSSLLVMGTYVAMQFFGYSGWDQGSHNGAEVIANNATAASVNTTSFSVASFSYTMASLRPSVLMSHSTLLIHSPKDVVAGNSMFLLIISLAPFIPITFFTVQFNDIMFAECIAVIKHARLQMEPQARPHGAAFASAGSWMSRAERKDLAQALHACADEIAHPSDSTDYVRGLGVPFLPRVVLSLALAIGSLTASVSFSLIRG